MINKTKSEKTLKWEKKDIVNNVLVYVINAILLVGLFFLFNYIHGGRETLSSFEYVIRGMTFCKMFAN